VVAVEDDPQLWPAVRRQLDGRDLDAMIGDLELQIGRLAQEDGLAAQGSLAALGAAE
jgi:hypothetical protein